MCRSEVEKPAGCPAISLCWAGIISHAIAYTESNSQHCTTRRLDDVINDPIFFCLLCVEVVIPVEVVLHLRHENSKQSAHDVVTNTVATLLPESSAVSLLALLTCPWLLLTSC